MSEPSLSDLAERLESLSGDVRKFGRAALAAQAAAEACTLAIEDRVESAPTSDPEALVRALLPVVDALDRVAAEAALLERETPRPSWLARVAGAKHEGPRVAALASGLALLSRQLEDALGVAGVTLDRRVGLRVDGDIHRVVETREGSPPGQVVAIVRAGCALGDKVLREADVVATKEK